MSGRALNFGAVLDTFRERCQRQGLEAIVTIRNALDDRLLQGLWWFRGTKFDEQLQNVGWPIKSACCDGILYDRLLVKGFADFQFRS